MFCYLGETRFERMKAPTKLSERRKYDFAEHGVLQGRPQLQRIGEALREISVDFRLHRGYCDPRAEIEALRVKAEAQEPLTFILGDGTIQGDYVIESIGSEIEALDRSGAVIWIDASMSLRECPPMRVAQYEQRRRKKPVPQKGKRVRSVPSGKSMVADANKQKLKR